MTKSRGIRRRRGAAEAFFTSHRYDRQDGCKLWPYNVDKDGYAIVWIAGDGHYSRLAVIACGDRWGPMPEPGMVAAHGPCHDPLCWAGEHVSWKTHKQNAEDRYRDQTALTGTSNHMASLTDQIVLAIREDLRLGMRNRDVAAKYNITTQQASRIGLRQRWKHLP